MWDPSPICIDAWDVCYFCLCRGWGFFLVGVTELLPTFLPLASRALGIPPKDSSYGPSMRVKVTPHPPVAEVFTEEQYRELAQQRRVDLALYSWARARLERVAQCMNVSVVWSKLN